MKNIYLFSGLGADSSVFVHYDFKNLNPVYIAWINPGPNESVLSYAHRLIKKYNIESGAILLGVSFGGLISIEISKIVNPSRVILISSFKNRNELPWHIKFPLFLKINKILPAFIFKRYNPIVKYYFGINNHQGKIMLKKILNDTDHDFLKWAIKQLARWDNTQMLNNAIHIHGTDDRLIPIKNIQFDYSINGGGHFMIYQKQIEINRIICKYLHQE